MYRRLPLIAFSLLALAGCGGGGSAVSGPNTTVTHQGAMEIQASNLLTSITTNGSSVYAMSGSILSAVYNDANPTEDETEIFLCQKRTFSSDLSIIAMGIDGSGVRNICNFDSTIVGCGRIEVSAAGTWLYAVLVTNAATSLYRIPTAALLSRPSRANLRPA